MSANETGEYMPSPEQLDRQLNGLGQAGVRGLQANKIDPKEQARYQLLSETRNSMERIQTALYQCGGSVSQDDTLLRSDIDNAVRHANRVAKNLRSIKKNIFPAVEKPVVETAEEKTNGLPFSQ